MTRKRKAPPAPVIQLTLTDVADDLARHLSPGDMRRLAHTLNDLADLFGDDEHEPETCLYCETRKGRRR